MLLKLEWYFVLIAVKVENADSQRNVDTNGGSTVSLLPSQIMIDIPL